MMQYGLVFWWLVVYLALLAAGMILTAAALPRVADRGAGVALPAALGVVWVAVYLVGRVSITAGLVIGLALLIGLAALATYRGVSVERRRYAEVAVVFSLAFLVMVAIRSVDAGIHPFTGEKFLDFGLLKSVLRADALPPEDMWFAGRPVNYYYGGHLVAAVLTRITGTEPRFAYNMALAGFYGMLVTAAYGLASSIAASRGVSRIRAGAFAAFFVGFASNPTTPARFAVWLLPDGVSTGLADVLGFELKRLAADGPAGFHYWTASRIIDGTINEFPLFAWLNGDLHAHMMVTPFVLLAATLLFGYYRTPASNLFRRRGLLFGLVPPLGGLIAVTHTWSFPTVGGLAFLAVALAPADPASLLPERLADPFDVESRTGLELRRHALALAVTGVVVALAVAWSLPFWLGTASGRSVAFLPDRSSMGELLGVHGAFAAVFVVHLLRHSVPALDEEHASKVAVMLGLSVLVVWFGASAPALALFGPMIVVAWILLRSQADAVSRATGAAGAVAGAVSDGGAGVASGATGENGSTDTATRLRDTVGFETVLLVAGAGIVLIVEFAYVREQAGPGRLNTVFKSYADVWPLWSAAAGAMLAALVENHSPDLALTGGRWRTALRALAVVLVVGTSMYGAFALSGHFSDGGAGNPLAHPADPTLDGLRWVEQRHPDEWQAIEYVDAREGAPNVVSAPGRSMYQWSSPVASLTGVPTLVGWRHEVGYRGFGPYSARVADADEIYTGPVEERVRLLRIYDVEYVYIGSNERDQYSRSALDTFDSMAGVTLVGQWGDVRLYRVSHEELSG
jgi:YYY domain-containing protein